jgi:hypothetical protein
MINPLPAVAAPSAQNDATPLVETSKGASVSKTPLLSSAMVGVLIADKQKAVTSEPRSAYETYMPVRDGFSAHALSVGVDDPKAISSSAGLDESGVVADARRRLDEKYASMTASGKPFDFNSHEGVDWYSLVGDLDVRSLNSIVSSKDDTFSKDEHTIADYMLQVQNGMHQGAYTGPTRLAGQFEASGLSSLPPVAAKESMKLFDAEAAKDKSVPSQIGRATMRVLLGQDASNQMFGSAKDRMLDLLVNSLTKARSKDPQALNKLGSIQTLDDLKKADWFADSRASLDDILAKSASTDNNNSPPSNAPSAVA